MHVITNTHQYACIPCLIAINNTQTRAMTSKVTKKDGSAHGSYSGSSRKRLPITRDPAWWKLCATSITAHRVLIRSKTIRAELSRAWSVKTTVKLPGSISLQSSEQLAVFPYQWVRYNHDAMVTKGSILNERPTTMNYCNNRLKRRLHQLLYSAFYRLRSFVFRFPAATLITMATVNHWPAPLRGAIMHLCNVWWN